MFQNQQIYFAATISCCSCIYAKEKDKIWTTKNTFVNQRIGSMIREKIITRNIYQLFNVAKTYFRTVKVDLDIVRDRTVSFCLF